MAYSLYTASYGASFANAPVLILDSVTGKPATILTNSTGGFITDKGTATLNSNGDLSVYIDTARTWTVSVTDLTPKVILPVSAEKDSTATFPDIKVGDQVVLSAADLQAIDEGSLGGGGSQGEVVVNVTDTEAVIKAKVADLLPEQIALSPAGRGRRVKMPAQQLDVGPMNLSTMQSMQGAGIGSTIIRMPTPGLTAGTYNHISVLDDATSFRGMMGQGKLSDMIFYGRQEDITGGAGVIVHGYVLSDRPEGRGHIMNNVEFHNYSGSGVIMGWGGDQFCSDRLRIENCTGVGLLIGSDAGAASDGKHFRMGVGGNRGGAVRVTKCAVTVDQFDFWLPSDFNGECTLELRDATRCTFRTGVVEGRLVVRGRNDQGTGVRQENTMNVFDNVNFKHDPAIPASPLYANATYTYDSYILLEDVEGVQLKSCQFGFDPADSVFPDFLIKHVTTTGDASRIGEVIISGGIGIFERFKGTGVGPRVGFRKHYSNRPDLVRWEGFVPGQAELVPIDMFNGNLPNSRDYVRLDGSTYLKADYPLGYLWATLGKGVGGVGTPGTNGTLDDVATGWTSPNITSPHASLVYAMRTRP